MAGTVQEALRARLDDDSVAVKHGDATWTWREYLSDASAEAAAVVQRLSADGPPHVGALLENSPHFLRALASAGLGGYVLCGINSTRRGAGLAADIRRSDCQVLLVDRENLGLLEDLDLGDVQIIQVDLPSWAEAMKIAQPLVPVRETVPSDTYMLIFTSGTSGDPKAVQMANSMVVGSGTALSAMYSVTESDVCYLSMPLFHSNGILVGWSVGVISGAALVPVKFSASRFLDDVRHYGVTWMNYVGKPLAYILATPERDDDSDNSLRVAFGNEANEADIAEFARRFDCVVFDTFGSTESAVVILRQPEQPAGSIGRGMDNVAVYNRGTVTECPPAEFDERGVLLNPEVAIGELVNVSGAHVFAGYYNDPAADAERLDHGMYWSGDLAYRDADGFIFLAGRTADWMRVDGENVAASPIERILLRLPTVSQAAVYGVPDERVGDQVMAALVLVDGATLTPDDLRDFLADQADLSPKTWPRFVRIAPSLPSTATNKVLKRQLRAEGAVAANGELWEREPRGQVYRSAGAVTA